MTMNEAEVLREKWKQQVDSPACEHPYQELERADSGGDLTGNAHYIVW